MKSLAFVLDILFPKKCLGCNQAGTYICKNCLQKIEIKESKHCPICSYPSPRGKICSSCQQKTHLKRLLWTTSYSHPLVKKLIKTFKYQYVKELVEPLSELLIKKLQNVPITSEMIIAPIPLHKRKLKKRGFNQAQLLAEKVADQLAINFQPQLLKRKRHTPPQAKIKDRQQRKQALKNVFEISPEFERQCIEENKNLLKNKTVIVIDDVFTSGATLLEAAKVLNSAGTKQVWGLVIAKG